VHDGVVIGSTRFWTWSDGRGRRVTCGTAALSPTSVKSATRG
jgi:hypothetical protein